MARRRKHIEGLAEMRRRFKAVPDAAREEIGGVLAKGGFNIAQEMKARAPRRTGATARSIDYQVSARGMKLRVGLLSASAPFYARIQDLGRKAQIVRVRRRTARGMTRYLLRVRAMAGKRFVTGRYTDLRRSIGRNLLGVWQRILRRTGLGA